MKKTILSPSPEMEKIEIKVDKNTLQKCKKYMELVKIRTLDEMIAKSVEHVLDSDSLFKKHLKNPGKNH